MLRRIIVVISSCVFIPLAANAAETITVIASTFPNAKILESVKPVLAKQGYTLEIKEIPSYQSKGIVTDKATPNRFNIEAPDDDVVSCKYDANFYQPQIYLEEYNRLNNQHLVNAGKVFYVPFAIYPSLANQKNFTSIIKLAQSKPGLTVGIPSSHIDQARALRLLEANKLIKLSTEDKVPNLADVTDNPYKLKIYEVDNVVLIDLLHSGSVDIAVMNSGRAYLKGMPPNSSVLIENVPSEYSNVVATTEEKNNSPKIKALMKALQSPEIQQMFKSKYKDIVKPSF